jgi:hypothetical protein
MIAAASAPSLSSVPSCAERPRAALTRLLDELAAVLTQVSPSIYAASVCDAPSKALLSYDHRERGTNVETDMDAALRTLRRLSSALSAMRSHEDEAVTMMSTLGAGGEPIAVRTTLGRELIFVVSHTIHHQALIGLLLSAAGCGVPQGFGLAPSTPRLARA